ncbi:hypothetical protein M422DRAFT_66723, partial [Sphaerobolus stellatus SS14]
MSRLSTEDHSIGWASNEERNGEVFQNVWASDSASVEANHGGLTTPTFRTSYGTQGPDEYHSVPRRNERTENEPLLGKLPGMNGENTSESGSDPEGRLAMVNETSWKQELLLLYKYTSTVFVSQILEYSLVAAPVISLGHVSTTAL